MQWQGFQLYTLGQTTRKAVNYDPSPRLQRVRPLGKINKSCLEMGKTAAKVIVMGRADTACLGALGIVIRQPEGAWLYLISFQF